jgi:hypothetical protein
MAELEFFEAVVDALGVEADEYNCRSKSWNLKRGNIEALRKFNVTLETAKHGKGAKCICVVRINIHSRNIHDYSRNGEAFYPIEDINDAGFRFEEKVKDMTTSIAQWMLDKYNIMNSKLENLEIDKARGEFYDKTCKLSVMKVRLANLESAVLNPDYATERVCSCCNEYTETQTHCGHYICIQCWNTLDKLVCPMCRKKIKCIPRIESDSGSEEED